MTTIMYQTGPRAGQQLAAARLDDERRFLAEDLARWAGEAHEAEHDAYYAARHEQHGARCCEQVREDGARNMYAFALALPLDTLRRRHASELEERTVERARSAGLFGPSTR